MKKFEFRGYEKKAISEYLPKSIEYGKFYEFITPFDWQYVKVNKNSRYVCIYDNPFDNNPEFKVRKKRFIKHVLHFSKGNMREVNFDDFNEKGRRINYYSKSK